MKSESTTANNRQQSVTLDGIAYGMSGGDLEFSSSGNEFTINGSQFSHDGNVYELTGDSRRINASNARTGTAYLIYFGKHNDSRFNNQEPAAPSNLAVVVYEDGKWKYDSQIAPLTEFTPQLSDIIIAAIDFDGNNSTISPAEETVVIIPIDDLTSPTELRSYVIGLDVISQVDGQIIDIDNDDLTFEDLDKRIAQKLATTTSSAN